MTRRELAERQKRFQSAIWGLSAVRWLALLVPLVFLPWGVALGLRYLSAPEWAFLSVFFMGIAGGLRWAWLGDVRVKGLHVNIGCSARGAARR